MRNAAIGDELAAAEELQREREAEGVNHDVDDM